MALADIRPRFKETVLKYERFAIQSALSNHLLLEFPRSNFQLDSFLDDQANAVVTRLALYVATMHSEEAATLRVPATWWDHFKLRWFPAWALVRWPAEFTGHDAIMLFPEVPKIPGSTIRYAVFDDAFKSWSGV